MHLPFAVESVPDVTDAVSDAQTLLQGLSTLGGTAVVATAAIALYLATRFVALRVVAVMVRRTESDWDDRFLQRKAPHRLALVPAALLVALAIGSVQGLPDLAVTAVQRGAYAVVVASVTWALFGALDAVNDIYERHDYADSRPIKGYLQLVKLLLTLVAVVLVVAILAGKSPVLLLSGLGAATAVLVLVFRDTILSFVASVQLATNDMIRVGDWITVETLQVDGDVLDIALHTITIRNFDMSYAFVPTHELIAEPFKNWRGMREVEGRRIMRSVHVDVTSVRFLTDDDLEAYARWPLLRQYLAEQVDALEVEHGGHDPDDVAVDAAGRMTNLELFREYVLQWLRTQDEDLHVDNPFPMMVRLLPATPAGQPVEVYCFAAETQWVPFERIQSRVFEHVHAVMPAFGLRHYQYPGVAPVEPGARTS